MIFIFGMNIRFQYFSFARRYLVVTKLRCVTNNLEVTQDTYEVWSMEEIEFKFSFY